MKRTNIIVLLLTAFGLTFTNCSSTQEKSEAEQAETEVKAGSEEAPATRPEPEPQPDNSELLEAYAEEKVGWFEAIAENEKLIAGLKSAVLAEKDDLQTSHQKKLTVLEQLNNKQKTKIALYKPQKEENWERFRKLITNDLAQINKDLNALRKEVL